MILGSHPMASRHLLKDKFLSPLEISETSVLLFARITKSEPLSFNKLLQFSFALPELGNS